MKPNLKTVETNEAVEAPKESGLDKIKIIGGQQLNGTIPVSGAKNAALKLMCAALLTEDSMFFTNTPNRLRDIQSQTDLLQHLGCTVQRDEDRMAINAKNVNSTT